MILVAVTEQQNAGVDGARDHSENCVCSYTAHRTLELWKQPYFSN